MFSDPAVLPTSSVPQPQYNSTNSTALTITQEELERRQRELEEKEKELAAREERLRNATPGIKANNWPPLPKMCPFGPCFYQDINVEIPIEFQKIVRHVYHLWMFYVAVLFLNMLGGLAMLIRNDNGQIFVSSLITTLFFTPLSFVCWFRPLYKAFRNDSSFNFMVFFFVFFIQCVLSVFWAIGIPTTASCGIITAFQDHNSVALKVFIWIVAVALIMNALLCVLVLLQVHDIYRRNDNVSLAKAQDEFRQGALKSEFTRNAAASLADNIVRQGMNQTFAGNNGENVGPGLRY